MGEFLKERFSPPLAASETPDFQRQNREFAAALKEAGKPVKFLIGEGYNHFEMFETLRNPYGLLGRRVLEQMKLKAAQNRLSV